MMASLENEIKIRVKVEEGDHDPAIIGIFSYYKYDKYPEKIRVSFRDGHTEIYDIRREQPHPLVLKNIEIMESTARNIKQGYVNQPARRRRRK